MLRTREGSDLPRVAQTQHLSPKLIVVQWTEHGAGAPWYISVSSYHLHSVPGSQLHTIDPMVGRHTTLPA